MAQPQKRRRSRPVRLPGGWRGRFSSRALRDRWGHCDYDNREIVISPETLDEGNTREIILHEMLHKLLPMMTEEWVSAAAVELDFALQKMLDPYGQETN